MNIWSWVHETTRSLQGEKTPEAKRLATLMREVPGYVTDDDHAKLDAAIPEALALAKAAKLPWVELFFRHWDLQSRVLKRFEGEKALGDAVALVDFAHSEAAHGCPQAVCTVQDLGVAYGIVDGPGFAEERRAVAGETLARIDATWPCFVCITGEYAAALVDGGDPRGAIAFLDGQEAKLAAAGTRGGTNLWGDRMQAHLDLGEPELALEALDRRPDDGDDTTRYMLARARVFAELGRWADAEAALPPLAKIIATPAYYERWAETMSLFVAGGVAPNDAHLGQLLEEFGATLEAHGAFRTAFHTTEIHARLAVARSSPPSLRQAVRRLTRLRHKLRPLPVLGSTVAQLPKRPQDPDEVLRDFQSMLEALQTKLHDAWKETVPVEARTSEALLGMLRDRAEVLSADERLIFLEMAVEATRQEPLLDRVPLAVALGETYLHAGLLDDARPLLEPFVAAGVYEREVTYVYGAVLRAAGDRAATATLVEALLAARSSPGTASDGYFLRGLDARAAAEKARGRHERMRLYRGAREAFDAVIAGDDSVMNTRRFAAEAAIALGDYPAALAYYTAICARTPDPNDHWERILLATRLGDWPAVRASAAALELPVDPPESGSDSDPIDEAWAYCRLRLDDGFEDLESPFETFALRTGPATARGLVISAPDRPQFYQTTFLMRPKPLDGDGTRESPYVYPALAVLAQPNYVYFTLDGAAPSDEAWGDLRRAVDDAGGELQRHSGESYRVFVENEAVPGVFGTLALPATEDVAAFHRLLTEHPAASGLVWLGLAAAAGDEAAVERQNAQADALGLAD